MLQAASIKSAVVIIITGVRGGVHTICKSTGRRLSCTAEWVHTCGSRYRRRSRRAGGSSKCLDHDDVFLGTDIGKYIDCRRVGVGRGVRTADSLVGAAAATRAGLRISGDVRMYIECQGEG